MTTLLACYLTGAAVLAWSLWFADEWAWYRVFEVLIWPIALIAGTIRALGRPSWQDVAARQRRIREERDRSEKS